MNDNDIILSINEWTELVGKKDSTSATTISKLFENCGNCFEYNKSDIPAGSTLLHAYPGIYKEKLYFFVIPQEYDNENYVGSFYKYTIACPVYYNLESNRIPESEAKARMKNWQNNYKTWIPDQLMSDVGMFQVFKVDTIDFEFDKSLVNMGLCSQKELTLDRADLIVTNLDSTKVNVYDDYSVPVPPYGPAAAQTDFYLLNPIVL